MSHESRRRTSAMTYLASLPRVFAVAGLCLIGVTARAQDAPAHDPDHDHAAMANQPGWTWMADGNVFVGYNYQKRLFADFEAVESQNWFMAMGTRPVGAGRLTVQTMLSLEPLTVGKLLFSGGTRLPGAGGSPQLFQTGESYQGAPLVNYQHPHDLIMGLGATYRVDRRRVAYIFGADVVGSPTLGPTAFMHRNSARDNPEAPLSHHYLDSTHITPGVLRFGVETGDLTFETSVFRGEEPNENRYNIDRPRLDSWAGRVRWHRGPWEAQFSGGRLHEPEWFEPYNVTRWTASIGFDGTVAGRPLAMTAAWGQNREFTPFRGVADAYLLEGDWRITDAITIYGRGEKMRKEVLGLGFHPKGFGHPHVFSAIDAATLGTVWDLPFVTKGRLGIGGDATLYLMSPDMAFYYAGSKSAHAFLRWRPAAASTMTHVH